MMNINSKDAVKEAMRAELKKARALPTQGPTSDLRVGIPTYTNDIIKRTIYCPTARYIYECNLPVRKLVRPRGQRLLSAMD
eukprot:1743495-Pyramimonas_sp.AAC.1